MNKDVECNIPLDGYLPSNWIRNKQLYLFMFKYAY